MLITDGSSNLIIQIPLDSQSDLQPLLQALERYGRVKESKIVTSIIKEEPPAPPLGDFTVKLKCDFCGGNITATRPYTFRVGPIRYYFCCRTCRRSYLEKYSDRIGRVKQPSKADATHSNI